MVGSYQLCFSRVTSGRGGGLPCPFFENQKKCPEFGKKDLDCIHPKVKFTTQNIVLRVSSLRVSWIFLIKCLSKCPNFTKQLLRWKVSGCRPVFILRDRHADHCINDAQS